LFAVCYALQSFHDGIEQGNPAYNQGSASYRGDGAQPGDAGHCQGIEGAGEYQDSDEESPGSDLEGRVFYFEKEQPDSQQGQGMVHLVFYSGFESVHAVRGLQHRSERMRPEGAYHDAQCPKSAGYEEYGFLCHVFKGVWCMRRQFTLFISALPIPGTGSDNLK
jgi:hypothetical protein